MKTDLDGSLPNKSDVLDRKTIFDIRQLIIEGVPMKDIASTYKIGEAKLRYWFSEFVITLDSIKDKNRTILGNKKETYYTEEELLKGMPEYTWEDLPINEKQFHKFYGKTFRKRANRKNRSLE